MTKIESLIFPQQIVDSIIDRPDGPEMYVAVLERTLELSVNAYIRSITQKPHGMTDDHYDQYIRLQVKQQMLSFLLLVIETGKGITKEMEAKEAVEAQ